MPKKILVPLDGSRLAELVLPHVETLVRCHGAADVTLLRVTPEPAHPNARPAQTAQPSTYRHPVGLDESKANDVLAGAYTPASDSGLQSEVERAGTYIEEIAESLRKRGIHPRTMTCAAASPAQGILETAGAEAIELIAMCSHGRSGLRRLVLGSVADQVVRGTRIPLLLVPAKHSQDADFPVQTAPGYQRILIALDGSLEAEAALGAAKAMVTGENARVMLLSVVPMLANDDMLDYAPIPPIFGSGMPNVFDRAAAHRHDGETRMARAQSEAQHYLDGVAARIADWHAQVETLVQAGTPAGAIIETAQAFEAGLICMNSHGAGGIQRMLLGSVTDEVIRHADIPVLVSRALVPTQSTVQ